MSCQRSPQRCPHSWRPEQPARGHWSLPPHHYQRAPTLPKHPGACLRSPCVTGDPSYVALQDPSSPTHCQSPSRTASTLPQLPEPACTSWTLPETSLQAACLHLGDPHTPPWGDPSTRAETSTPGCPPRPSMQAGSRQHQAGTTSWHRLCSPWVSCPGSASGWQRYVLLGFFIINQVFLVPSACMALLGPPPAVGRGGRMHL